MKFTVNKSIQVLSQTPLVLNALLSPLDPEWTGANEGEGTWCPYDVIGHLIHGEKTDWIPRTEMMLRDGGDKKMTPFDRFAMYELSKDKTLQQLLGEFAALRKQNLDRLRELNLTESMLDRTAIHPAFGTVTLRQHLSSWVAHDLGHIAQICRVMAKQYREEAGPWIEYLRILQS